MPVKLAALVDRSGGAAACWPWIGRRDKDGYGRVSVGYTTRGAHVLAFEAAGKTLAPGQVVRHSCDNPPCCNPDHLLPGTKAQNNADCRARGRTARGSRNAQAKLTDAQVEDIRREAAGGAWGIYTQVAAKHGISSRQASYIAKGERRGSNDPRRAEASL
ncbi:MAG TPA: HNH endonuclease signature motif containing protein [Polyangia bacterium]|nr:HNH endonuclease signature motif containing protein [Polyangia bacterium]